jgi:hypothetical protein
MIDQGRWPADGSKLDFAQALGEAARSSDDAMGRWGRATLLLEQQNGHLDVAAVRQILADHPQRNGPGGPDTDAPMLCGHGIGLMSHSNLASMVVALGQGPDRLPVAWCAFGLPCSTVYFPLFPDAELPGAFSAMETTYELEPLCRRGPRLSEELLHQPEYWSLVRDHFGRLQTRFDQEADEFAVEGAELKLQGNHAELERLAGLFAEHVLELFTGVVDGLAVETHGGPAAAEPGGGILLST